MFEGEVKIEGAAQFDAALNKLERKVARQIAAKAMRAGAHVVLTKALQTVPVKSGTLKKSLKVRAGKRKPGLVRMVVQTREGDYRGEAFYGAFLEFGHKIGSRKKHVTKKRIGFIERIFGQRGRTKGVYEVTDNRKVIPPKPFLGPAFEQSKVEATKAITDVFKKELK